VSASAQTAVWNADLDRATKYVLVCMADHADHIGGNIRPSIELIAWKSQYNERQVRRIIRDLEAAGILARQNDGTGGRAKATEYRIVFEKLPVRAPFERTKADTAKSGYSAEKADTTMSGYQNPDILETWTFPTQNPDILNEYPDISDINPDIAMSPEPIEPKEPIEPLVETRAKKPATKSKLTPPPDEFQPDESLYKWAYESYGFQPYEVNRETEACLDWHRANGSRRADWVATWRVWIRKAATYRDERMQRNGNGRGYGKRPTPLEETMSAIDDVFAVIYEAEGKQTA